MKSKKCKNCKKIFVPERQMQSCCSFECSIEWAKKLQQKSKEKKANKIKKDFKANDKSELLKLAQMIVNKYIRLRDLNKPCCTCGHLEGRQFHAGHFENVGGKGQLRFYTLNIHKQCSICNNWKSGNLAEYERFMINKYGIDFVEKLKSNNQRANYSVEYLQRLIKVFRKKIKLYERKSRG